MPLSSVVKELHQRTGIEQALISRIIAGLKDVVREKVAAGETVDMGRDFGHFTAIDTPTRERYIPATGERRLVVGSKRLRFRPGRSLQRLAVD